MVSEQSRVKKLKFPYTAVIVENLIASIVLDSEMKSFKGKMCVENFSAWRFAISLGRKKIACILACECSFVYEIHLTMERDAVMSLCETNDKNRCM